MKNRFHGTARALGSAIIVQLAMSVSFSAQTIENAAFTIKGISVAKVPVANRVVIVFPIDTAEGKPVARLPYGHSTLSLNSQRKSGSDPWEYYYSIVGGGPLLNPRTETNAKGEFTLSVPRAFFKNYRPGELALGLFFGTPLPTRRLRFRRPSRSSSTTRFDRQPDGSSSNP